MMFRTHLAFALFLALLFLRLVNVSNIYLFILLTLFFSIIPDIDSSKSFIGRKIPIISHIIQFIFRHRGIFHSIFPVILLAILFTYFHLPLLTIALIIGYLSHLIGDSITKEGIKPLHPLSNLRFHSFLRTDSFAEFIIFLILVGVDAWLVLVSFV